jgi:hypothetical protein
LSQSFPLGPCFLLGPCVLWRRWDLCYPSHQYWSPFLLGLSSRCGRLAL